MYTSSVAGTFIAAVREFVDADVIIYQVSLCCIVLGFPCFCHVFYDPPLYRGPGTAPFDAPRSPSLALGPVLSPGTPSAVWGGRGAVEQPRGVRWRPGAAGLPWGILRQTYSRTSIAISPITLLYYQVPGTGVYNKGHTGTSKRSLQYLYKKHGGARG